MAVVNTVCANGHVLAAKPLRAVRPCKGCGEQMSTAYDCESGCYGKCAACWVAEVRDGPNRVFDEGGEPV